MGLSPLYFVQKRTVARDYVSLLESLFCSTRHISSRRLGGHCIVMLCPFLVVCYFLFQVRVFSFS